MRSTGFSALVFSLGGLWKLLEKPAYSVRSNAISQSKKSYVSNPYIYFNNLRLDTMLQEFLNVGQKRA
jgi:hypothetical protein